MGLLLLSAASPAPVADFSTPTATPSAKPKSASDNMPTNDKPIKPTSVPIMQKPKPSNAPHFRPTSDPASTQKPTISQHPTNTQHPSTSSKPTPTSRPTKTVQPTVSMKPTKKADPTQSFAPSKMPHH